MRFRFSFVSWILLCGGVGALAQTSLAALTCADLHLVPAPRECVAVQTVSLSGSGVNATAEKNEEDEFAFKDLEQEFAGRGLSFHVHEAPGIVFYRAQSAPAVELLQRHHLKFDPAMHDEGYAIVPAGARGLDVIAETPAGIF